MPENATKYFSRQFVVKIEPIRTTHQADLRILKTKDGRQFIGKMANSDIKAWVRDFKDAILKMNVIPDKPYTGPLEVSLYFGFPNIQADKGAVKPMTTKPDFDNLAKSVLDALTDMGFWADDSQIVFGKVAKFRTPSPFLAVSINPCNWMDETFANSFKLTHTD